VLIVGVDLSLTSTGLCAVRAGKIEALHCVRSTGTDADTIAQTARRIHELEWRIFDWIDGDGADLVVLEGPSNNSRFGKPHERSGLWWRLTDHLVAKGYPIVVVRPTQRAKYGTGNGNSKKPAVWAAVKERYLPLVPERAGKLANNDIGDAVILASMASRAYGYPVEPETLSESILDSLKGVSWPIVAQDPQALLPGPN
jgi:crossover junction endodeoxyribonuclease RuvC